MNDGTNTEAEELLHSKDTETAAVTTIGSTPSEPRGGGNKLVFLDGLRGLWCSIVVFAHWTYMPRGEHPPGPTGLSFMYADAVQFSPLRLIAAGEFAVAGFFVLSGFVLTRKYMGNTDQARQLLGGSAARRFPRLFIPSTVSLLLYYALLHFSKWDGSNACHELGDSTGPIDEFTLTYVVLDTLGQYFWMPALYTIQWTMQVEFGGSLIVYLLAYLLTRPELVTRGLHWAVHAALVLLLPVCWLATDRGVPRSVQYLQPFVFGLLLAHLDGSGKLSVVRSALSSPQAAPRMHVRGAHITLLALFLLGIYLGTYPVFNTPIASDGAGSMWAPLGAVSFGWLWISAGGMCWVAAALISPHAQRFLGSAPMAFLGKISFGVYLVHYIVLCAVDATLMRLLAPHMGHDGASFLLFFAFIAPVTLCAAYAFYVMVDAPAVAISHAVWVACDRRRRPLVSGSDARSWALLGGVTTLLLVVCDIPAVDSSFCPKMPWEAGD